MKVFITTVITISDINVPYFLLNQMDQITHKFKPKMQNFKRVLDLD